MSVLTIKIQKNKKNNNILLAVGNKTIQKCTFYDLGLPENLHFGALSIVQSMHRGIRILKSTMMIKMMDDDD